MRNFNTYTCFHDLTVFLPLSANIPLFSYTTRSTRYIDLSSFITDISLIIRFGANHFVQPDTSEHVKCISIRLTEPVTSQKKISPQNKNIFLYILCPLVEIISFLLDGFSKFHEILKIIAIFFASCFT